MSITDYVFDKRLSLKAVGLYTAIICMPDETNFSVKGLAEILKDGVDSVRTALSELETAGYITRLVKRNHGRILGMDYIINKNAAQKLLTQNC